MCWSLSISEIPLAYSFSGVHIFNEIFHLRICQTYYAVPFAISKLCLCESHSAFIVLYELVGSCLRSHCIASACRIPHAACQLKCRSVLYATWCSAPGGKRSRGSGNGSSMADKCDWVGGWDSGWGWVWVRTKCTASLEDANKFRLSFCTENKSQGNFIQQLL